MKNKRGAFRFIPHPSSFIPAKSLILHLWLPALAIGAAILVVTALHFLTPVEHTALHQIYQRLYYLPIVAAALFFGWRGGVAAALFASVAYLPHVVLQWHHSHYDYALNQYAEIVLFNFIGLITGLLADRQRRARERATQTASELQRAYAELRQTFAQLLQTEKLASLGELSAGLVHEIRNPLAGIKGAVEIIADELAPDSPRREFAALAQREIDRLDKLVNEFLRFARPAQLAQTPSDLNEIVRSVVALLEQPAAAQNVIIRQEPATDLPLATVDAEQVRQVLLNLGLNALQAMPHGGVVTFRTVRQADFLLVEVEDEGGGVAPAMAARIFDPFFTTKEKGVGLGLAVAYKIAAQHGGTLTFANGPHEAIFQLRLPAANSAPKETPEAA